MVSRIESLATEFAKKGFSEVAEDLKAVAQKHVDQLPEHLDVEKVYRHYLFDYYPDRGLVVPKSGEIKTLTSREVTLLDILLKRSNRPVSSSLLLERVFGTGYNDINLKDCIKRLNKKLEPNPHIPRIIVPRRGLGYFLLDPDVTPQEVAISISSEEIYRQPGLTFYPERYSIIVGEREIVLTKKENDLFRALAQRAHNFVYDETLISQVWPDGASHDELKLYIRYLRRKIEPDCRGDDHRYIRSKHGVGYGLFDPSKE